MSERLPNHSQEFLDELTKIQSPVDRAAFQFFYDATIKEGIDMKPGYTWDKFDNGIASFDGTSIEFTDKFVKDAGLVPNYTAESARANGIKGVPPLMEALTGPFVRSVHLARQESAVRIMGNHPSMATPYLITRSLTAAYMEEYGVDIRPSIYIVVGAYPTVLQYNVTLKDGSRLPISPVDFGRTQANLLLTAPKTASTESDDIAVQTWMRAVRAEFKVRNHEILSQPGNILIVHPSGRRARRSESQVPPYKHTEYLPDSSLDYITQFPVPTFAVGVGDNLLNDAANPGSVVNIVGDPRKYDLTTDKRVEMTLEHCTRMASYGEDIYGLENWKDRAIRLGRRVIGREEPNVE